MGKQISNRWLNDLLGTNIYKTLEFQDKHSLQYYNFITASVISK